MGLDGCAVTFIVVSAIIGYYSGAVRQLARWMGLAAAFFGAKPAALFAARMGWINDASAGALRIVLFPVLFFIGNVSSRVILNLIEPGDERGPLDQGLGTFVGGVKGVVIVYVLACLAITLEKPLTQLNPRAGAQVNASAFVAFARDHNPFSELTGARQSAQLRISR